MTHHAHDHAPHGHGLLPHGDHLDDDVLGQLLDLDPQALHASWSVIHAALAGAVTTPPRRVVDLGAGTGTGTVALATLFPGAEVVAVDSNPAAPGRIATRVAALGLGDRVRTVVADLDHGWPDLGPVDLLWASMALHHLGDPDRTLRELHRAITSGGTLVAVEFDAPVQVLADGVAGDVEARAHAAMDRIHRRDVPELGSAWAQRFAAAGFTIGSERVVDIDVRPPLPDGAARYAQLWLQRMAAGTEGLLGPADVTTLRELGTDAGIAAAVTRGEVHLHGARTVTIARRP